MHFHGRFPKITNYGSPVYGEGCLNHLSSNRNGQASLTGLALAVFWAVAAMDDVAADLDGEVAADGTRLRREGVGGANHLAGSGNNALALPHLPTVGRVPISPERGECRDGGRNSAERVRFTATHCGPIKVAQTHTFSPSSPRVAGPYLNHKRGEHSPCTRQVRIGCS